MVPVRVQEYDIFVNVIPSSPRIFFTNLSKRENGGFFLPYVRNLIWRDVHSLHEHQLKRIYTILTCTTGTETL